jgi:CheY-like chemotaxis protein
MNDTTLPSSPPDEMLSILCVDDEESILKSLVRTFRGESFGVLTAASGEEGLAILKDTANIGLILSDQRMPGMSGAAFLEALGKNELESLKIHGLSLPFNRVAHVESRRSRFQAGDQACEWRNLSSSS